MSEEDVALLRAVREWRPPDTLHPIAMEAWHLYAAHGRRLPPVAIDELRALLERYGGSGADLFGLGAAIEGLARFIILLDGTFHDHLGSREVAQLAREFAPRFEPFWRRVAEALENVRKDAHESFLEFSDRPNLEDRRAPVYGEAAPTGSVPLRALAPIVRPRPWGRRRQSG
jgi:hypothetical protein